MLRDYIMDNVDILAAFTAEEAVEVGKDEECDICHEPSGENKYMVFGKCACEACLLDMILDDRYPDGFEVFEDYVRYQRSVNAELQRIFNAERDAEDAEISRDYERAIGARR